MTWNRRDTIRSLLALGTVAALGGCSSGGRRTTDRGTLGSVGSPLPGPAVGTSTEGTDRDAEGLDPRTRHLLERWAERRGTGGAGGVVGRAQWAGSGPARSLADPMGSVSRITVHHDGMSPFFSDSKSEAMQRIESIRRAHRGRGWADIGYHYAIDRSGQVYECRPMSLQGAHVKFHNEHNIGVLVLGNFMEQRPTPEALSALDRFLVDLMRRHRVPVSRVFTHQELRATACPGVHLQRAMDDARGTRGVLSMV